MTTKTIQWVNPKTRTWEGPNGPVVFVSGEFDDGEGFSVGCKPDNALARVTELEGLVGKPGEYELEPGKEFNGRASWKLKSWPGKPQQGGFGGGFKGGGGKTWTESYAQSRECKETEQRSIQKSVALQWACESASRFDLASPEAVLGVADIYFGWLSGYPSGAAPAPTSTPQTNGHANGNGNGMNLPQAEVKPTTAYVKWEADAFTLAAKHKDIWPTFHDALAYLKPQLINMGLGSPRLLKENAVDAKFQTLLGALKNRVKQVVAAEVPF